MRRNIESAMRVRNLSFRDRLLILGVSLTAGSLLLYGAVMWGNNHHLREVSYVGCLRAAEADLDHIAESIDRLCDLSRLSLEHQVREKLHSATVLMDQSGALQVSAGTAVSWEARNQFHQGRIQCLPAKNDDRRNLAWAGA